MVMRVTLRSCFSCALEMNVSSWNRAVFWSAIKEEACYVDSDLHAHSLQRGAPCERTATVKEMERNDLPTMAANSITHAHQHCWLSSSNVAGL